MNRKYIVIGALASLGCLAIGIAIGFAIGKDKYPPAAFKSSKIQEAERINNHRSITDRMSNKMIRDNLEYLTDLPHAPGSERNKELGDKIAKQWIEYGFDNVDEFKYNIYLPFPQNPANISALNEDGTIAKNIIINNEPALFDSEKKGEVDYPFNAFGTSGVVTAPIVYCNYGESKDFAELEKLNISLVGKILMFRYGKASRSAKVLRTELRGGVGAIIFSDPYDNSKPGDIYPNGFTGNKDAIQRGTVNRINGDSLSEGYPSKDGYFRLSEDKYSTLNNVKIPSQPISEAHANEIFALFTGKSVAVPKSFKGGLPKYALQSGRNFSLKTDIKFETKSSYTYCGTIYGSTESDRYVLLGNHRDAWIYGAADPSSGTAAIMEIGRALGNYKKENNWRPQRSIKICSWGAEEPGVLDSYEWADEHRQFLMNNVVLYINVDMAVEGNFTVRLRALDYYAKNVKEASKNLESADDPNKTLYQDWLEKTAKLQNKKEVKEPKHDLISSGSDYKALWHLYGVASGDFRYYFSRIDYPLLPQNAQYHTRYESFDWMIKFVDPDLRYHLTIARLMLASALLASDKVIVPLYVVDYVKQVQLFFDRFNNSYIDILQKQNISLDFAQVRLNELLKKSKIFQSSVNKLSEEHLSNPYIVRQINDKIIHFEKNFLVPNLIRRVGVAHVVYAESSFKLKEEKFPGISEAIYYASKDPTNDWDAVRKQITMVVWCFDSANMSLDLDGLK